MEDKLDFIPLNNNILLIPYIQKRTESGLVLSEMDQRMEFETTCIVSAIGPKVQETEYIKEGVFVLIPKRTGKYVYLQGYKYILVNENDILGVVKGIIAKEDTDVDIKMTEDNYNERTI